LADYVKIDRAAGRMPDAASRVSGPVELNPGIDRGPDNPYTPRWDKSGPVNGPVNAIEIEGEGL